MRRKLVLRLAASAALGVAVVVAAVVLLRSGESYTVHARFQNAAQLVKGNLVQVSGQNAGKVTSITVTPDGQADVALKIDEHWAPLRQGTQAMIRQASLSGVANRYVDLRLAPAARARHPRRRQDRRARHDDGGRPRPALQHVRRADAPVALEPPPGPRRASTTAAASR